MAVAPRPPYDYGSLLSFGVSPNFQISLVGAPGIKAGDLVIVIFGYQVQLVGGGYVDDRTIETPAGWTLIDSLSELGGSQNGTRYYGFWRIASQDFDTEQLWNVSVGNAYYQYHRIAYAGFDTVTEIDAFDSATFTGLVTSLPAPAVTTVTANSRLLAAWLAIGAPAITLPGGMTLLADTTQGARLVTADEAFVGPGSTGTRTATASFGANGIAVLIAVRKQQQPVDINNVGGLSVAPKIGVPRFVVDSTTVANTGGAVLEDERALLCFLVELQPWNRSGKVIETLRLCDDEFITEPSESPANIAYDPILIDPLNVSRTVFGSGRIGGSGLPSSGDIQIATPDSESETLAQLAWDGRVFEVKVGGVTSKGERVPYSDFAAVHKGRTASFALNRPTSSIAISDAGKRFTRNVQTLKYAGTGGIEGDENLKGQPKPLCCGTVKNGKPVLVDRFTSTYQIHEDTFGHECRSLDAVYFGDILVDPSEYTALDSDNCFRLLTAAFKEVTFDATGPEEAGDTAEELIRYFTSIIGPLSDPGDFANDYLLAFGEERPEHIGYYLTEERQLDEVLTDLVAPDGLWTIDNDDRLQVSIWTLPLDEPVLEIDDEDILSIRRLSTEPPAYRIVLGYDRCWKTQTEGDISTTASLTERGQFSSQEYRLLTYDDDVDGDGTIREDFPDAVELRFDCLVIDPDEAQAILERLKLIYLDTWVPYEVTIGAKGLPVDLARCVDVTSSL